MSENDHLFRNRIDYSILGIIKLTLPLIISALSSNIMYIVDRFMLARYSVDSMNAAALGGNMVAAIGYIFKSIAHVAEVYVGQDNGAQNYKKLAEPVWQMIYLSLFSAIIFIPAGYFSNYLNLFPEYYMKEGVEYQGFVLPFEFVSCVCIAFAAFFIGQGKTILVTIAFFVSNVLNIFLDYILIFGIEDMIPSYGCKGAAIATVISSIVQTIILGVVFFNRYNRENYNTCNYRFNKELFKSCCRTGIPISIGRFFGIIAWYIVYVAISHVSKDLATIHGIGVGVYVTFFFFADGFGKAVSTLSSNLIGMKNIEGIKRILRIFLYMTACVSVVIMFFLIIYPEILLTFLNDQSGSLTRLYSEIKLVFMLYTVIIIIDTLSSVIYGVLLAGGDTKYPSIINISFFWGVVVIPVVILYFLGLLNNVGTVQILSIIWTGATLFFIYRRYKTLKWYNSLI